MMVDEFRNALRGLLADAKRGLPEAIILTVVEEETRPQPKPKKATRRDDWHYDSQGYCDNPGRGY